MAIIHDDAARRRGWRSRGALLAILLLALAGIAGATSPFWWEGFRVSEEPAGDGKSRVTVTNPQGAVEFDEVLDEGTGVFHLEDGTYIVVQPAEPDQAAVQQALDEIEDSGE
jgi:hypothetical protein